LKNSIRRSLTQALEMPSEVLINVPVINIVGNGELDIENYKSILEYSTDRIAVNASGYIVMIEGKTLELKCVTSETVSIRGNIASLSFKEL